MQTCEICGRDISDRRSHARYCKDCYHELNLERARNRWENGLGTTAMGNHTKIKKIKGEMIGMTKEYYIIQNELKRLGLLRYMRKHRI